MYTTMIILSFIIISIFTVLITIGTTMLFVRKLGNKEETPESDNSVSKEPFETHEKK